MKSGYEIYAKSDITKELLDSVKVGDKIRCNGWHNPFTVKAVTPNYFFMSGSFFGKSHYSICEKKPCEYSRNNYTEGSFRIGPDNLIFGGLYNHNEADDIKELLQDMETGDVELSARHATADLLEIRIMRNRQAG